MQLTKQVNDAYSSKLILNTLEENNKKNKLFCVLILRSLMATILAMITTS